MNEQSTNSKKTAQRLQALESEIDRIGAMAVEALSKAKATGFHALEGFISQQDAARQRMRGVGTAGGDAWQELKQGLEAAWGDLHGAVQNAVEKFQQRERESHRKASQDHRTPAHSTNAKPANAGHKSPKAANKTVKKKQSTQVKRKSATSAHGRTSKRSS